LNIGLINTPAGSGVPEEVQNQVYPGVWATEAPGKAKNASPIIVKLKQGTQPVRIRQYPLRMEDREGIRQAINRFIKYGLLIEYESEYNSPILPVKKPDGSYQIVQDLRAINRIVEDLHPVGIAFAHGPRCTWWVMRKDGEVRCVPHGDLILGENSP